MQLNLYTNTHTHMDYTQTNVGPVHVGSEDSGNRKEARTEAQGAQGLTENCGEGMSPLSRLIRGFRHAYH